MPVADVAVAGAGCALMGKEAAMACTVAVEDVIGDHYNRYLILPFQGFSSSAPNFTQQGSTFFVIGISFIFAVVYLLWTTERYVSLHLYQQLCSFVIM